MKHAPATPLQNPPIDTPSKKQEWWELAKSLGIAVIIAIVFRTFVFEPFHIPSSSMKPTLEIGDYIFVSKYSYGYSRYSFPFGLNVVEGRAWKSTPVRGDVVVFKLPSDPSVNFIKRLIGMPGDHIQVKSGVLYINGTPVRREFMGMYPDPDNAMVNIPLYRETLPSGITYPVLDQDPNGSVDNTDVYIVPEGHYFMMGDNRDNSTDSRFLEKVGFVPEQNLVGRALVVLMPQDKPFWYVPGWFHPIGNDRSLEAVVQHE
ncbi:MAG: lepB [Rickettsiales bacterium]|nr:lepB [Rickettsiales bacterium]